MSDLENAVEQTGMCLPLAARILRLLADSGASQMEIITALGIVENLRHHLKATLVPADVQESWSPKT